MDEIFPSASDGIIAQARAMPETRLSFKQMFENRALCWKTSFRLVLKNNFFPYDFLDYDFHTFNRRR